MLVLDCGAITALARRSPASVALLRELRASELWPPVVPTPILVECLTGVGSRDATEHRLLRICHIVEQVPTSLARRAALLRSRARRGSAVDALVVAFAEPGGAVLTGDPADVTALAAHAGDVIVQAI